jgi:alkylhydroperoxidase/carboxymuconolactone decarboxylase family protein YurZ
MLDENKSLEMLKGFQAHYNYDTSYMKEMLKVNPKAYETFEAFLPMASFSDKTPKDVLFVAKLTSMKNEDCGECLQLNVYMAIEAGVDKEIIKEILFNKGENLNSELKEVYDFTLAVVNKETVEEKLYTNINSKYSKDILTEIALAIASTKVFPTVKKVLNNFHSCSVIDLKV